jgi:hypothetical protein
MQLWGQNKQKVKVRSIFVTDEKPLIGDSANQKTSVQIREARNKIRTNPNSISKEKIDESVLEFRKSNGINDYEQPLVNLNPLIVYEKNELEIVNAPVIEIVKPKIEEATKSYEKFKEENLTTKYKSRKKKSVLYKTVFTLLSIIAIGGLSYFNFKRLEGDCGELQKTAQKIGLQINQDCKYEIKDNWWNFGYNYSEQIKVLKNRIADLEFENQQENQNLKSKILTLNVLLDKKDNIISIDTLAENKLKFESLTKEKETKINEFNSLLSKAKYLDEVLHNKKVLLINLVIQKNFKRSIY